MGDHSHLPAPTVKAADSAWLHAVQTLCTTAFRLRYFAAFCYMVHHATAAMLANVIESNVYLAVTAGAFATLCGVHALRASKEKDTGTDNAQK